MKENKYDDETFFQKYSEMNRSKNGLKGAGEWSELQKVLPDFQGKHVLDLGCGYGWHCLYAAIHGAEYVLGTDISNKMLEIALEKNGHPHIEYRQGAMEDLNLSNEQFDIVMSSLALHYVLDYENLVEKIEKWLKPKGYFVFSVEHPLFTAEGKQDWYYDNQGNVLHFPIDNYFYEGKRDAVFLGEHVIKYHRTLTTYLNTLLIHHFELLNIIEPQPPQDMMDLPGMADEMRRPMMLIVLAQKKF
ncbi:class I SAM-dependent methyltransferase [Candidatus Stoquefichus massiliensis]|uniref:class I SAM-dependent methyltransferase n=1 Tax=Candidatus Stoquefichus massiliensis TaxID=1470350 RepID=UPI00048000A0|nr:class I SAM-dependent methyltransferase [Candidatus Stoquefichus massiliensis]